MDHDTLLKDGSILRFASLGGHCVHITHGADGRGIGSGLNRYGIINEKPLKEDPSQALVCDNGLKLADGCLLRTSLMATHTEALLDEAADVLQKVLEANHE